MIDILSRKDYMNQHNHTVTFGMWNYKKLVVNDDMMPLGSDGNTIYKFFWEEYGIPEEFKTFGDAKQAAVAHVSSLIGLYSNTEIDPDADVPTDPNVYKIWHGEHLVDLSYFTTFKG